MTVGHKPAATGSPGGRDHDPGRLRRTGRSARGQRSRRSHRPRRNPPSADAVGGHHETTHEAGVYRAPLNHLGYKRTWDLTARMCDLIAHHPHPLLSAPTAQPDQVPPHSAVSDFPSGCVKGARMTLHQVSVSPARPGRRKDSASPAARWRVTATSTLEPPVPEPTFTPT